MTSLHLERTGGANVREREIRDKHRSVSTACSNGKSPNSLKPRLRADTRKKTNGIKS